MPSLDQDASKELKALAPGIRKALLEYDRTAGELRRLEHPDEAA